MPNRSDLQAKHLVWTGAFLLTLLHHDAWLWDNRALLLGFLPAGLAYHIVFSLLAGALWAAASRWAWPDAWERWAEEKEPDPEHNQETRVP